VRFPVIGSLITIVLLIAAIALPSKRDTSVAAWWSRVRYQLAFLVRVVLALVLLGGVGWYLLVQMLR
jgi:hypothetical protein